MDFQEKKRIRQDVMGRGLPDPARAFNQQRATAGKRGIEWRMTFDEWWGIWKDYYHLRGTGTNGLVMARENDSGAYEVGNVHLTTKLGNAQEYHNSERAKKIRESMRVGLYEKRISRRLWAAKSFDIDHLPPWHNSQMEKDAEDA